MEAWIPLTITAALVQSLRFMVQKQLTVSGLSTGGATLARFLYSAPLIAMALAIYLNVSGSLWPVLETGFWAFALVGGLAQILATMCVVALFGLRNFAVGITFKKTEVMLTAIVGFVILGDTITFWGGLAIAVGFAAVILLSDPPAADTRGWRRLLSPAVVLGLTSGLFFAISGVGYRGAVLALETDDLWLRTLVALSCVTVFQTLALGGWLAVREAGQIGKVLSAWRPGVMVGVFSMVGSFCWFAAFSLQTAAYVFALGQIELVFSALIALFLFKERITGREWLGMGLLAVSIVALVALG